MQDQPLLSQFLTGPFARVSPLWDYLTRPSISIRDTVIRRQSRLLSGLLICLITLGSMLALVQLFTIRAFMPTFMVIASGLLIFVGVYFINRTGYYRTAALITIVVPSIVSFVSLCLNEHDYPAFNFFLITVLLSSILLNAQSTILFSLGNIVVALAVPLLNREWAYGEIFSMMGINLIAPALIVVFMLHRDAVEQARQTELRVSEEKYRSLFDNSSDAIFVINPAGYITDLNEAGQNLIGYSGPELATLKWNDLYSSAEEEHRLEKVWRDGLLRETETRLRRRNGDLIDCVVTVSNRPIGHGEFRRLQGIARDITAQKQAEAQRLELALIHERMDLLREFVGNLSHDFKTPLTIINTNLYLLSKLDDPEVRDRQLEQIKTQTLHLERLIQDILVVSRLDSTPTITPEPVDLTTLISDVEASLSTPAAHKSIKFEIKPEASNCTLSGSAEDLYRAVVNLVENAIHYTPEGGTVTLTTRATGEQIEIEVSDTGIGIDPEDMPNIFDRFYRAEKARNVDKSGAGLGLAIVKRIADMHGGKITVESTAGKGTTFCLQLPLSHS